MDDSQFDRLTRSFSALRTRRTAVQFLGGVAAVAATSSEPAVARRKKHKKPCKPPKKRCGGDCLAVLTDDANCGSCGNRCGNGQTCKNGQCKDTSTPTPTSTTTLPPDCPPETCCQDNQPCSGSGRCLEGVCQPRPNCLSAGDFSPLIGDSPPCCSGLTDCSINDQGGMTCVCRRSELSGACLNQSDCRSGNCLGYRCLGCSAGEVECSGQCVTLDTQNHCGACGHACARNEFCKNQACKPRFEVDATWPNHELAKIHVESDGTMFFADFVEGCVQRYSPSGTLEYTYGVCGATGSDNQHLNGPSSVVTKGQLVYITDAKNDRVQIFSRNGGWVGRLAGGRGSGNYQLWEPQDITVDRDGNFYVADQFNHRVQKFDSNGVYVQTFGSGEGAGEGQLGGPVGVVVDSIFNVYVAEYWNDRIQKFDNAGRFINVFGSLGSGPGQLNGPNDLALASNGDVFVPDFFNARVAQFTYDGEFIGNLTDSRFRGPTGVFIDKQDHVYVADYDWSGVIRFALKAPNPSRAAFSPPPHVG